MATVISGVPEYTKCHVKKEEPLSHGNVEPYDAADRVIHPIEWRRAPLVNDDFACSVSSHA
jgi:hypothetical protein